MVSVFDCYLLFIASVLIDEEIYEYLLTTCRIVINPLSANPAKRSNTLKQLVGKSQQIVWVCLTILWGWRLKD